MNSSYTNFVASGFDDGIVNILSTLNNKGKLDGVINNGNKNIFEYIVPRYVAVQNNPINGPIILTNTSVEDLNIIRI